MLLRGRHSLNFGYLPVVHWAIILVLVHLFNRSHPIWAISNRKGSTYMLPHSLFELPVLSLQNIHNSAPLFCHFPISATVWNRLAINIKMKRLCATLKSPPWSLTSCCSIYMTRMKVTPMVGLKRGPPLGSPSGSTPSSPSKLERRMRQLEGLEAAGRSLGSSLSQMLAKVAAEVGPLKRSTKAGYVRPTEGGRLPTKSF